MKENRGIKERIKNYEVISSSLGCRLQLTLKKKWFDMIASGEKKEEYREIKDYWNSRIISKGDGNFIHFDHVLFKNGYAKDAPMLLVECKGIKIKEGEEQWGAVKGEKYYYIQLGEVVYNSLETI